MSDSSTAVADAVASVSSVSGAVEAVANAPESISNLFELGARLLYGTGYTVAYAVVFPTALVFAAIPKGNALVQGLIDGSASARSRAEEMFW